MILTREEALKLHRQMWTDMLTELGETCKGDSFNTLQARSEFKFDWCRKHLQGESIMGNCLLCEYALQECEKSGYNKFRCYYCPINWGVKRNFGCEMNEIDWRNSPISVILALPERSGCETHDNL